MKKFPPFVRMVKRAGACGCAFGRLAAPTVDTDGNPTECRRSGLREGCLRLCVTFERGMSPLGDGGGEEHEGCVLGDPLLKSLLEFAEADAGSESGRKGTGAGGRKGKDGKGSRRRDGGSYSSGF